MKMVKKWALIFLASLVLLLGAGVIFTLSHEEEIKQYGIQQVNGFVNTEINAQTIDVTFFEKFPSISLKFGNVSALEITDSEDKEELFAIQAIYLEFNLIDIIKGNYTLNSISIEDGFLNLKIDKSGKDNYHFWKEKKDSTSALNLELENVKLKNIELSFKNELKNIVSHQVIKESNISGNFSDEQYNLKWGGLVYIENYQKGKATFVKKQNLFFKTAFAVNNTTGNYVIKEGAFSIEDLHFFLNGVVTLGDASNLIDLQFKGKKLDIVSLVSVFPENIKDELEPYNSSGQVQVSGSLKGWMSATQSPEIMVDFKVNEGEVEHKSSGVVLKQINCSGRYTNGTSKNLKTSFILIEEGSASLGSGTISGTYKLSNFENPLLEFTASATALDLEELHEFWPSDTIETIAGELDLKLRVKGRIKDMRELTASDFRKAKTLGNARVKNGTIQIENSPHAWTNLNGTFSFNNNDVRVDELQGEVLKNDFRFDGYFKNLLPFLFTDNEKLFLKARFLSSNLILDDFVDESSSEGFQLSFPDAISFDLTTKIDHFAFRNFEASDIQGIMKFSNKQFSVYNASFKSMSGTVDGTMKIDATEPAKMLFTADATLEAVDVTQLFNSFNNFGQTTISGEHLKGKCNAKVRFSSLWNEQWVIDQESVKTLANLTIDQGELINFKPLHALSRFIEVEELNHIRFSSLTNEIKIENKKVIIPEMDIKSSALSLNLSGVHQFNNEIEYHFSLFLRDLLWRKAKKPKKSSEEFGHIQDDGLGRTMLFLKMTGTVDDPKVSYDRKGLRKKWNEDLKQEKATIKKILKEEFGKGSDKKEEEPKEDYDFKIEWEEEDVPKDKETNTQKVKKEPPPKKKGWKWLDKITDPNEEEVEEYDPELDD